MGIYISKPPYGGCGGERVKEINRKKHLALEGFVIIYTQSIKCLSSLFQMPSFTDVYACTIIVIAIILQEYLIQVLAYH